MVHTIVTADGTIIKTATTAPYVLVKHGKIVGYPRTREAAEKKAARIGAGIHKIGDPVAVERTKYVPAAPGHFCTILLAITGRCGKPAVVRLGVTEYYECEEHKL